MSSRNGNRLLLFVVGEEVNSRQAKVNLQRVIDEHFSGSLDVEVVDVLQDFRSAIDHKVFVTPALVVGGNGDGTTTLYGDLANERLGLNALRNSLADV